MNVLWKIFFLVFDRQKSTIVSKGAIQNDDRNYLYGACIAILFSVDHTMKGDLVTKIIVNGTSYTSQPSS